MPIVTGVAYWAHVQKPNTKFEPAYQIDLVVDKDAAGRLQKEGINVKEDDRGFYAVFKRKAFDKNGAAKPAPAVVDSKKERFTGLIGNGSLVNVQYRPYDWKFGGKKGRSADLIGVQVLELNEYAEEKLVFEELDGFEAQAIVDDAFGDEDLPFNK